MKTFTRVDDTTVQEVGDKFKKAVVIKRYRTEDGFQHEFTTMGREDSRAVAVVALTVDNHVIVSRQFRAGRQRYVEDLPGGGVEDGEDLEAAAKRELLEETGYEVGTMHYMGKFSWDAYSNLTSHYFFATDCRSAAIRTYERTESEQGLEADIITIDRLIDNAKNDNMTDAVAVLMAYEKLLMYKNKKGGV